MELAIQATVTSDDGKISKSTTGKVTLDASVYGSDAGVAKQDFLTQTEGLIRIIAENMVPALYDAVSRLAREAEEKRKAEEEEAAKKAMQDKREQDEQGEQGEGAEQDHGQDPGQGETLEQPEEVQPPEDQ